ncbi:MAG: hypothetical protein Tsb007_27980 [Rhizobacter sp.]
MVRVADAAEFKRLLEALAEDIVYANIHWRLFQDLRDATTDQPLVWAQSRTFWYLTLRAHIDVTVLRLCRAYDQQKSSLHLLSWLQTIRENVGFFEKAEFERRMSDNPFVASLAAEPRVPDLQQLDEDIQLCSVQDMTVKRLNLFRSNIVAHRNARTTVSGRDLSKEFPVSWEELEILLLRAREILNRYSNLFSATVHSVSMIGRDDYKYIFSSVATAVQRSRDGEG